MDPGGGVSRPELSPPSATTSGPGSRLEGRSTMDVEGVATTTTTTTSAQTTTIAMEDDDLARRPLQQQPLVDSESSDSGFQDVVEVPAQGDRLSNTANGNSSEFIEVPIDEEVCSSSDEDVATLATTTTTTTASAATTDVETVGSLLGMLFRRSTMRRSMRPFVPSGTVAAAVAAAEKSALSTGDSRRSLRQQNRNVQFVLDTSDAAAAVAAAAAVEPSQLPDTNVTATGQQTGAAVPVPEATVDTILVSIPEHEAMLSSASQQQPVPTPSPPYSGREGASQATDTSGDNRTSANDPTSASTTTTTTTTGGGSVGGGGRRLTDESDDDREVRVGGFWSHPSSSLLASLTCTVGMFDICRFSYLSYQYGGSFILQFLMLTVVFGIPLLSFQMSAGQYMGAGIMNMWKVSPVFQGIGISVIFALSLIGIYSVVPVSWMFIYFRDAFVTTTTFRWGECRNFMRADECLRSDLNSTEIFKRAIPAYFHNRVLKTRTSGNGQSPDLIFENVFNLAVIWVIVFICLSKGTKSYGKVLVAFSVCPLVCFYLVAIEILRRGSTGTEQIMSLNTDMGAFFLNGWSWLAAAREVFFIWGINGAVLMQIASHNKFKHNIKRDCAVIMLITLSVIMLSAFLTCACIYIIYKTQRFSHRFIPSSYEMLEYSQFIIPTSEALKMNSDMDVYMSTNYLLGVESTTNKMDSTRASGYQVARLATEILPMALVQLGPHRISAFWPVLFYLALIAFGLAQQLAIWRCVIEGFVAIRPSKLKRWETCITFFSCVFGFVFGLPFTAEGGAFVVHFMDVCVGCIWWLLLVYLAQLFALVLVRGKPYTSDDIVSVFADTPFTRVWLAPVITFSWNVLLPLSLMVLAIASFKLGDFGRMFSFEDGVGYAYWPSWAKQFGALIQVVPILIIPLVSLVQASRYLSPSDQPFATRLDNFLRPMLPFAPRGDGAVYSGSSAMAGSNATSVPDPVPDDPPPKYTPPPSYSTATGLKILKRLNSLRRSFRRSQRGRASTSSAQLPQQPQLQLPPPSSTPLASDNPNTEMEQSTASSDNVSRTTILTTTSAMISDDVPPSYGTIVQIGAADASTNHDR